MKSIFLKFLMLCFIALTLESCKKDETQVVSNVSPAGTLTASTTVLDLLLANGTQPAVTLTFPAPTVTGYVIPVTSTLQFDLKGNNFATPKEYVITTNSYTPTINEFNTMALALGAKIGTATQIEARLKSAPAPNAITYSNVITLTGTPYLASSWIYAPGAYQGWDPATADSLISLNSDGVYTGIIAFTPGNLVFKITPEKKWDVAYGDAGSGNISTAGGDINVGTAGLKQLSVDMNTKKITIAEAAPWSVIGNVVPGTDWNSDLDMKFINDGKGSWQVTADLIAGEFKFRKSYDWPISIGNGGGNIAITSAGNYTLTLTVNEDGETGTYTVVKN